VQISLPNCQIILVTPFGATIDSQTISGII